MEGVGVSGHESGTGPHAQMLGLSDDTLSTAGKS